MAEANAIGIETLRDGIHTVVMLICEGIKLAKKAPLIVKESKDIDLTEAVALIVDVATTQAPKIMEALKA